jgi:phage portal protein BeeE
VSLFAPKQTEKRSEDWTAWEGGGGAPGSSSNPTGLVPFFAAIRHIVDYLSSLPLDANRLDGDARAPMSSLPPLLRRLNDPGDIGLHNWIGQWAYGIAAHGNTVGWITAIDGFGFPTSIRWLRRIDWSYDESMGIWYLYGNPIRDTSRIVHSPWIVPTGCKLGISPADHFADFWKAGKAAQDYADVSRGGGAPPYHLQNTVLQELDPTAARTIQKKAKANFTAGEGLVSGKDWKIEMFTAPPNQMQFLDTLALSANQTAAIFGIDAREIGGTGADGSITYTTDESKSLNRANNLRPYMERFEDMIARLLPERQFVKLNVDATLRTDAKTRTEILGLELLDGRRNVDEARALMDLPPLPNGAGQRYNVPTPGQPAPATR